ncbi:MAG: hypothetical protein WKF59_21400 [Chitinophagaceae bacterium]
MSTFETIAVVLLAVITLAMVWLITEFTDMKVAIKEKQALTQKL